MCNFSDFIAEFGLQDLRQRFQSANSTSPPHRSAQLANLISSVDTQNRQQASQPNLPRTTPLNQYISNLVFKLHNPQKTPDVLGVIVAHLHDGVHIQALQEVNMPLDDINTRLCLIAPGGLAQGTTNGHSNGDVTVIHPDVAPYVRPLQLDGRPGPGNVSHCLDTLT